MTHLSFSMLTPKFQQIWSEYTWFKSTKICRNSPERVCFPVRDPYIQNKANLRDLIAATSLIILLKFDPNHRFFSPCDLEIWWMTSKNNRAPLLYYIKLCASLQINWWIKTEVKVRKRSIRVKIGDFLSRVTLKFNGWHWKTIGHLFFNTSSFVHHFKAMGEFKLE